MAQREQDEIRRIVAETTARLKAPERNVPEVCEDCGNGSDLGRKCRACYQVWRDRLHEQNLVDLEQLQRAHKLIRSYPNRKLVASVLRKLTMGVLSGRDAEVAIECKKALDGSYGGSMAIILQGITDATDKRDAGGVPE